MRCISGITLKKGRERSVMRGHPWIFSGAVETVDGEPRPGDTVSVFSSTGQCLGQGAYSPASQIRVRLWTFGEQIDIDAAFFKRRIQAAVALRETLRIPSGTNAYRWVSAESDGVPGVVVDRYGDFLVCQFLSAGAEQCREIILDPLKGMDGVKGIYERSDADVRRKEGLKPASGVVWGEAPPDLVEIDEHGIRYNVDIRNGHKTGFYLDQRENRQRVRSLSAGRRVLNCFAYTGGFGLAAYRGGAVHVTNVEDMAGAIAVMTGNFELNGCDPQRYDNVKADVFQLLRRYNEEGRTFDLIVLDPPKFADSQRQLDRASRGYKDINRLAFKLLQPGGLLFTFSCSGLMKMPLFQKIVADAAIDGHCRAHILQWLGQSPDHPVQVTIPESHYLKGLLLIAGPPP